MWMDCLQNVTRQYLLYKIMMDTLRDTHISIIFIQAFISSPHPEAQIYGKIALLVSSGQNIRFYLQLSFQP